MKLHRLAVALCLSVATTAALADSMHNYPPKETARAESVETTQSAHVWQAPVAQAAPTGKTRQQVLQELKQAERDGLIQHGDNDYPPSESRVQLNKEKYAARQRAAQAQ
ncbi:MULTISPECIES: DUF4148 domain-containing protein [Caballeronia]|uniref:DUF4148 domain-containing protein n=1 Tax=Caballeronia TaxID=1827195 RepID=UPI0006761803|nr:MULTISPECIES: DUF4148 domain-containing protein [Caballeronia]MCE4547770.1 DUF4148 domain-containing protein [Caballeronia sp. PC1]MCE4575676.1 DUF4148 domain-containing protein [Caballeronia sp. CLC5]